MHEKQCINMGNIGEVKRRRSLVKHELFVKI